MCGLNLKATHPNTRSSKQKQYTDGNATNYVAELDCLTHSQTPPSKRLLSSNVGLCLALVFMIFAWGTSYKLSLYKVENLTSSTPAKVCTRGSDAAKSDFDHAADGRDAAPMLICLASLVTRYRDAEERPLDRSSHIVMSDRSPLRRAPILYLRPPPHEQDSLD